MDLKSPITDGGRALKMYAGRLERLGIYTFEDLLYHIPSRYEDFSLIAPIATVQPGETVTLQGRVTDVKNSYLNKFKTLQKVRLDDGTGHIDITWFNQPFLTKTLTTGTTLSVAGKVGEFAKHPVLQSPEYEIIGENTESLHTGRLVPIYPETRGVSSKWLRRQIFAALFKLHGQLTEYLPERILRNHAFPDIATAIEQIHFPKTLNEAEKARKRLAFNELFLLQLKGFTRRAAWKKQTVGNKFNIHDHSEQLNKLIKSLPFILTTAQERAVTDILHDLESEKPMNRLLQGDVGSGKTVVAAITMYEAFLNGYQSVLMAPTEILAEQHYKTISNLLEPFGIKVSLVTSSKKLQTDTRFDVLVGTHAVLSEKIVFTKLGLVVIDEQQRFGVEQRGVIRQKGNNPHLLTMTATPIPRTIALTMYGDLDLSYLNEMPKGRQIIKTWLVPSEKREAAYDWIRQEIKNHDSQTFIICPFIEESENMVTVKAATKEYERLTKDVYPDLRLGMLHGRQKAKEKDAILSDFRAKKFAILVATPVVEVGIDIPNATVIVIEAAERFGLAQLHQLRGRVGRGDKQSYCLLFTEGKSEMTQKRLKAMETTHVGAELAELDLKLRGAGELYGTRQSGTQELKIADFSDTLLIEQARNEASKIFQDLKDYPKIENMLVANSSETIAPD